MSLEITRLGTEALLYMKEHLADGRAFSQFLLQTHNLDKGSVITFLPPGTSSEVSIQFTTGGKLPHLSKESEKEITSDDGSRWRMVPKPDTSAQLVGIMQNFLLNDQWNVAVFEDASAAPTDPWLSSAGTRLLTYDDEVFHCLGSVDANEPERILNTIDVARSWRFVAALTCVQRATFAERTQKLDREELQTLAQEAKIIIVGAYDGEGYLVWQQE
jgi:hypothetical protein